MYIDLDFVFYFPSHARDMSDEWNFKKYYLNEV